MHAKYKVCLFCYIVYIRYTVEKLLPKHLLLSSFNVEYFEQSNPYRSVLMVFYRRDGWLKGVKKKLTIFSIYIEILYNTLLPYRVPILYTINNIHHSVEYIICTGPMAMGNILGNIALLFTILCLYCILL